MTSDFELDDLSKKRRAASTPSDASSNPGLHPPAYPEELKESTTASWTWVTSVMFVMQSTLNYEGEF